MEESTTDDGFPSPIFPDPLEIPDIQGEIAENCCDMVRFEARVPGVRIPTRATTGAAGYDMYCYETTTIKARSRATVGTGIAMEIPAGYYGRLASKSGLSNRYGLEVGAGVIDSDFRGEIKVVLYNHSEYILRIVPETAICQVIFEKIANPMMIIGKVNPALTMRGERGLLGHFSSGPDVEILSTWDCMIL